MVDTSNVKAAPTELSEKILTFLEENDPAFGYAQGVPGQENRGQWLNTFTEKILQNDTKPIISSILEITNAFPSTRETGLAIMDEVNAYENTPAIPVETIAGETIIKNAANVQLNENSDRIKVDGHTGTWYVIDSETIDGKRLFLLESEQYGDEAAALIVNEKGELVLDDVYNGFDDYREQALENKERVKAKMANEQEKPNLLRGDVIETGGKRWLVKDNNGFMLSADNLDPNDNNASISWIGNIKDHDYTLISRGGIDVPHDAKEKTAPNAENGHFRLFYDYANQEAVRFSQEKNWKIAFLTEQDGANGDTYIVYDDVNNIPKHFRDAVRLEEQRTANFNTNRYYEPELQIDGTAEELFLQARNGYMNNPQALDRLKEILDAENRIDEAQRVGFMADREREAGDFSYSVAAMKLDALDGIYELADGVKIRDDGSLRLSVTHENGQIAIFLAAYGDGDEPDRTGVNTISDAEFLAMSRADFERFVNETFAYSMQEVERDTEREREQDITHGEELSDAVDVNKLLDRAKSSSTYFQIKSAVTGITDENGVADKNALLNKINGTDIYDEVMNYINTPEHTIIDGHDCIKTDEWQNGTASFIVAQDTEDETFFYALVTESDERFVGTYSYEHDSRPDRKSVEDEHLDYLSSLDIDRHEAEFGADGNRAFPYLNDEPALKNTSKSVSTRAPMQKQEVDETLSPKDQLKQRLENGVRSVLDSENFKNWLSTGGKLYYNNYSFRNAMLVWLQKPEASYVMGYEKWKDFGRNVRQGAQGAKIFIPLMASEKFKGGLFRSIKNNLNDQLSKSPGTLAVYRLGSSNLEFTMNAQHIIGYKVNGQERSIFSSDEETKRFIDRAIIGKVPTGFTVGTVFDAQDVIIPETLWVKNGFTKDEITSDENGNPIKNRRGETQIINTPERQARFQPDIETKIAAKDPEKMGKLFDACVAASERKGVPVYLRDKDSDDVLQGGAKGYFKRAYSKENPNGFIVIDKSLEPTEKCAVLFHEMGHADLHKNLESLAQQMGEDKISREMREVQAEATAFATASTFGIETDTSSFNYLAVYSRGFELQDFQKSLSVIYKETQALTADIKAELDIRGLNLNLTEKAKETFDPETMKTISTRYVDFATQQNALITAAYAELPSLIEQSKDNPELLDVLKYQKENLDSRKQDVEAILTGVESLNKADLREEQEAYIQTLEAAQKRVSGNHAAFEILTEKYITITEQARGGLKRDFENDPKKAIEAMKPDYPRLAKMTAPQLKYIESSEYVKREYVKLLRDKPQEFVNKACNRAELLSQYAAKNGTVIEISLCEQWTEKPIFTNGTFCHPKIADAIIAGSEAQIRGFKAESEKRGEYFPFNKCNLTVFTPNKNGNLLALHTRIDIGDGEQTSLKDHLEQICKRGGDRKTALDGFTAALSEHGRYKDKLYEPSYGIYAPEKPDKTVDVIASNHTTEEWNERISGAKNRTAQERPNDDDKEVTHHAEDMTHGD
ncbi:hypothetical protein OBV_p-00470 (plasmid) [Oscillibacter valericigenes Sjm18-20]|nr:hypothetical protein OBV_p-00470 [Oscillibacter valericigenes Sjm18-20]